MSESEKRELLMDFLRTGRGPHLGLTAEKFNDRGRIIDDSRFPDTYPGLIQPSVAERISWKPLAGVRLVSSSEQSLVVA